jgi:hypothetical protein
MKRLVVPLLLVAALASASVAAATVTVVQEPLNHQITLCNGDIVDLTGTLVTAFNGNVLTSAHTQDMVGIDETTGTIYHGQQTYFDIVPPDSSGGGIETFMVTTVLAAPGAPTFRVMGHFHITVLPDGTIAVIFATDSTTCT